jgi:uncharacterized phage protein gp47/JayE
MPGPYPLATLSVVIDQNGITAPPFEDIFASLQASYQQIYGSDTDLAPDSQDGQWLAVQAQAIHDTNQALIAGYFSYAPTTAQGIGLSSVVKINGLRRLAPSNSTVELLLVGVAGTIIPNGVVGDGFGNAWDLPVQVVIPVEGQILETATAAVAGAISAAPNTVTNIQTLMPGWQTATNPQSAFPGAPVETDATLRKRQSVSTSLPAITPRESIAAAVANVPGVGRTSVHDNDSDFYDQNLVPPHSIAVIVEGGDAMAIAQAIALKKNTGCGTYGTTQQVVFDQQGVPLTVDFFYLIEIPIFVTIQVQPLPGYLETTGTLIMDVIAAYIQNSQIGEYVYASRLAAPANLAGDEAMLVSGMTQPVLDTLSSTYVVRAILIGTASDAVSTADVIVPFSAASSCNRSNVTLIVSTVH